MDLENIPIDDSISDCLYPGCLNKLNMDLDF
ncbi:uncharacterized protein METZ01_LOCUS403571 [marine metagenome]|uniref:Uncharacterized protein n=1 Tax=marine metagenome TaxID=408172 RepID=A0A382VW29_9ZZZZ